jgi:transcriptional regulator with XRE-family HTH domain
VEKTYEAQVKQFGKEIKRLREGYSMTQQFLADECEVDIRTIQRIERGDAGMGLYILFALAAAFKLQPFELLKELTFNV